MTVVVTIDRDELRLIIKSYIAERFDSEVKSIDFSSLSETDAVNIELGKKLPPERGGPGDL